MQISIFHTSESIEFILISNTFLLFRFSSFEFRHWPRPTTNVQDLDLLQPPVSLVTDKRAPDLHWFSTYSLFGLLCLGTGKTLKLSKLNNWPDSMMYSQMITSQISFFFKFKIFTLRIKILLVATFFNMFCYERSRFIWFLISIWNVQSDWCV